MIMNQAEELHELRIILAAICRANGGVLNVSTTDMASAPVRDMVMQSRLDNSGIDIYFWDDTKRVRKTSAE